MITLKSVISHILAEFEIHLACDSNTNILVENKGFLLLPKDVFLTFKNISK